MHDPIVEEVRKAREDYSRKLNNDIDAICADLARKQKLGEAQVVSFPKRPARITPLRPAQSEADTNLRVE